MSNFIRNIRILIFMVAPLLSSAELAAAQTTKQFKYPPAGFVLNYPGHWTSKILGNSSLAVNNNFEKPGFIPNKGEAGMIFEASGDNNQSFNLMVMNSPDDSPQSIIDMQAKTMLRVNKYEPGIFEVTKPTTRYKNTQIHYQVADFAGANSVMITFRSRHFLVLVNLMYGADETALLPQFLSGIEVAGD